MQYPAFRQAPKISLLHGFALRDIGENLPADILMAFKRPFRVGDFVETGAIRGRVLGLNIRDTRLKTTEGKDHDLPIAGIFKNPLMNDIVNGFCDSILPYPYRQAPTTHKWAIYLNESLRGWKVLGKTPETQCLPYVCFFRNPEGTVIYWVNNFTLMGAAEKIKSDVLLSVQHALSTIQKDSQKILQTICAAPNVGSRY